MPYDDNTRVLKERYEAGGGQISVKLIQGEGQKRGYSPKPILLGQSRGGMMTLAWAFRHQDKVRACVGIYPVCNLASWPLKNSKAATFADFAIPEVELVAKLPEFNPVDNLKGLLANKVPMFVVHGTKPRRRSSNARSWWISC